MAKGLTIASSRPAQTTDAISFPVLTYTDALPRSDLRALDSERSSQRPAQQTLAYWDFHRPRTSGGAASRRPRPDQGATFDFQLTAPPEDAMPSCAGPDCGPREQQMIGIALGSPGMFSSEKPLPPASLDTSSYRPRKSDGVSSSWKPSKWKKISGMFRAKSALAQISNQRQTSNTKQSRRYHNLAEESRKTRPRNDSTEEWPSLELEPRTQMKRSDHHSRSSPEGSRSGVNASNVESSDSWPLLQVDIPDVQMERYSVMFGNVVNENQKPSLLARRSKTLDRLYVPDADNFLKTKTLPVPQRRATSPARSSFTLFPTSYPAKAARILGTQNVSRGPHPLLRAQTLPVESHLESSTEQPRVVTNAQKAPSSESLSFAPPLCGQSLSPRSSSGNSRKVDKPLPAVKPELHGTQTHRHQTHTARRDDDMELPRNESNCSENAPLQAKMEQRPTPLVKDKSSSMSSAAVPSLNSSKEKVDLTIFPAPNSSVSKPRSSPMESTRMPLVDMREALDSSELSPTAQTLEISIARSISMSAGKRQMLVPIAARVDHLDPHERFVDRKTLTPEITDGQYGHRKAVSQELQIESV